MSVFDVEIIAGSGQEIKGNLCFPDRGDVVNENSIIVVPHGGEEYHVHGMICQGIITEIGNRLCHLAIVTREFRKPMVKLAGAIDALKDAERVWMRCGGTSKGVVVEIAAENG